MQIKTKIVSCHTANSKPVKQEVNSTVILPPLVFPGQTVKEIAHALAQGAQGAQGAQTWVKFSTLKLGECTLCTGESLKVP